VVVNAAGPWSHQVNELAGVLDEFSVPTRALRQEVHVVDVPDSFGDGCGAVCADTDLGTYFRPQVGGTLLVGGLEPECDRLEWVDDPDSHDPNPSVETWQAQTWRLGKRLPGLPLPRRPVGLAGLYDVTPDWIPVYDRTCLDGYYVAVGTSGNQFKNAPVVGELVSSLIEAVEGGHDHDQRPLSLQLQDGLPSVDMGHYSRLRQPLETTSSVLG
jgi:glycine/D-amino acid oxidase-like deaminating enzyme